jgi:hypothetical protein
MAVRFQWQFVQKKDIAGCQWIWQRLAIDGTISQRCLTEFPDYAVAVNDAMSNAGFSPKTEGWSIISVLGVTHFEPGKSDQATVRKLNKLSERARSKPA